MAYGAEFLYQGMSNAVPNFTKSYDAMTAEKRKREDEEREFQRKIQLQDRGWQHDIDMINADVRAQQDAGNPVLYSGSSLMQPQRSPTTTLPQGSPNAGTTPIPPNVAAKDNSALRLLGAGGLGAPTYGSATPDNPQAGQAYQKPVGPSDPLTESLRGYHDHRLKMKQKEAEHMDAVDMAQQYTAIYQDQLHTETTARIYQNAINAFKAGDPRLLAELVGSKYDLNNPDEVNQAMSEAMSEIIQLRAKSKALKAEQSILEPHRMRLGVPAFQNDFEAAQWMNRMQQSKPSVPGAKAFTPSVSTPGTRSYRQR